MLKHKDTKSSVEGAYAEKKRAEEEVTDVEKKFQALFNLLPDPVVIVDGKGNFLVVNDKVEEKTGFKREELLGKNFLRTKIVTAKSKTVMIRNLAKRVKGMQVAPYEIEALTKDDKKLLFEVNATKIEYEGKPADIVIFRDITEHKSMEETLRESEKKFRQFFENAPEYCYMISPEGKILDVNRSALKTLGYNKKEVIGKPLLTTIYAPSSHEKAKRLLMKWKETGKLRNKELNIITKRGEERTALLSVNSVKDGEGKLLYSISVQRDITERKQMQKKLKEAQKQLLRSERLAAIGELAAMVGHDLRNPLTGIKNAAYYLKKRGVRMDDDEKGMIEVINKAVDHADRIINELLDYSREMRLELAECSPKSLLSEVLSMVQIPDRIKVIDRSLDTPVMKVDCDRIKRVLANLIKNAIDAMPETGVLEIRSNQKGEDVEFVFIDSGVGIAEKVMAKLFTPLFTTKAQGMGFGLAICKRVVDAHGGRISVVGKGTTFTMTLPIKPKLEDGGEKTWINTQESLLSTTMKT